MRKYDGFDRALSLFQFASREIPAYRDFLARNGVNPLKIKTHEDFSHIPLTDKKNYIKQYSLRDLSPRGEIAPMAYASSGSSGKPTFWLTGDKQEEEGGEMHEQIFRDCFGIKKSDTTLVVNCFAMGIWVAGTYTLASCRAVSRRGYAVTTVSPGIERDAIMTIFRDLAPQFRQVVLVGYPPFLMDSMVEIQKEGIVPPRLHIITAGDRISEEWRDAALRIMGRGAKLSSVINLYGCADAASLGCETPLAIFLRRRAFSDQDAQKIFFGDIDKLPTLVSYNPNSVYFETVGKNLVFTTEAGIPLVRYDIHDTGSVMSYGEMWEKVRHLGIIRDARKSGLQSRGNPFVIQTGRTDVAVTFYALNIYPENISAGLQDRRVKGIASGRFLAFTKLSARARNRHEELHINVELLPGAKRDRTVGELLREAIHAQLLRLNYEYKKLYTSLGKHAMPQITTFYYGDSKLQTMGIRGILYNKGKKPKMID